MATPDEILERAQWDFFWARNEDATVVDRPEILYIRSARDLTYLNSVVRTRATDGQLEALVDEIGEAHAGVHSRWLVCPQSRPRDIEALLSKRGYTGGPPSHAYALAVDAYRPRAAHNLEARRVDGLQGLRDWYDVVSRAFGSAWRVEEADLARQLDDYRDPAGRLHRFVVYDTLSNAPVSAGDIRLYSALGFGYLLAGGTVPEARGRGGYSTLLDARIQVARACGIGLVGLYAMAETSGAVVARQGFVRHGPMNYWERSPGQ